MIDGFLRDQEGRDVAFRFSEIRDRDVIPRGATRPQWNYLHF